MQRNRLGAETSPYLLQHAGNPVDWYPWGEEAFDAARRAHKPVLLSVGYSACHWCHVMAHESFEDPAVAAVMNERFVNVKVDREERPDLDRIYQIAQQLLTQRSGGWPLTLFLDPENRQPFFGGTYFAKQPHRGVPGFADVLERVSRYFQTHRDDIRSQNAELARAFERLEPARPAAAIELDASPLEAARRVLQQDFDSRHGGFGPAPKFPQPGSIERCLRQWYASSRATEPDLKALYMATLTLSRMAEGGIYDQLGGGFARYSVDEVWMIPHFEKMLYDNGQLLALYAGAALATGEPLFQRTAAETADWLLRDMRSPEGAFYSSLDADSEGHEGRFYVWQRAAIEALLTPAEYDAVVRRFGLDREPNFEGAWHLHAHAPTAEAAVLDRARAKLLAARNLRVWPARDEKILTSWNALTIKGMALAGRALGRTDLVDAAAAAVDFTRRHLWRDGRLLATTKDGRAHLMAYLDDYAFLADALLELLQARWRSSDLHFAQELAEVMLERFEDAGGGGFFFTASDHERLIHRGKTFSDDATPSGNAVAASALSRLGYLLAELRYLDAAERTLQAAWLPMNEYPRAHMSFVTALEDFLRSPQVIVIREVAGGARRDGAGGVPESPGGGPESPGGAAPADGSWARALGALYAPDRMIFSIPADAVGLPASLSEKRPLDGTTAYVCTGMTCGAPFTELAALARHLAATPRSAA